MSSTLFERYQQAKAENKAKYARDLAAYLNVSEGELLHCRVGHDKAQRLNVDAPTLLKALASVGKVKAITRNEYVVHEQVGRYDNAKFSDHAGLILNPRALDLRMFFSHWDAIFTLTEDSKMVNAIVFNFSINKAMRCIKSILQMRLIWRHGTLSLHNMQRQTIHLLLLKLLCHSLSSQSVMN